MLPMLTRLSMEDVEEVVTATVEASTRDETSRFHMPGNQEEGFLD